MSSRACRADDLNADGQPNGPDLDLSRSAILETQS
jgi:hypothetical protein